MKYKYFVLMFQVHEYDSGDNIIRSTLTYETKNHQITTDGIIFPMELRIFNTFVQVLKKYLKNI